MPPCPLLALQQQLIPCTPVVFVVVNGVPSVGVQVMIGSGKIEKQATATLATLPTSQIAAQASSNTTSGDNSAQGSGHGGKNSAEGVYASAQSLLVAGVLSFSLSLLSSLL